MGCGDAEPFLKICLVFFYFVVPTDLQGVSFQSELHWKNVASGNPSKGKEIHERQWLQWGLLAPSVSGRRSALPVGAANRPGVVKKRAQSSQWDMQLILMIFDGIWFGFYTVATLKLVLSPCSGKPQKKAWPKVRWDDPKTFGKNAHTWVWIGKGCSASWRLDPWPSSSRWLCGCIRVTWSSFD